MDEGGASERGKGKRTTPRLETCCLRVVSFPFIYICLLCYLLVKIKIYKSKEKVKKAEFEIKRSWSGPVRGNDAFSQELTETVQ